MTSPLKLNIFLQKSRVADPKFRINWTSTETSLAAVSIYTAERGKRLFYKRINQNEKAGSFEVPFSYTSLPKDYEVYYEQGDTPIRIFLIQRGDANLRAVNHTYVENNFGYGSGTGSGSGSGMAGTARVGTPRSTSSTFWWIIIPVLLFFLVGFMVYTSLQHKMTAWQTKPSPVPSLPAVEN